VPYSSIHPQLRPIHPLTPSQTLTLSRHHDSKPIHSLSAHCAASLCPFSNLRILGRLPRHRQFRVELGLRDRHACIHLAVNGRQFALDRRALGLETRQLLGDGL
jgi:hypothetical protein